MISTRKYIKINLDAGCHVRLYSFWGPKSFPMCRARMFPASLLSPALLEGVGVCVCEGV